MSHPKRDPSAHAVGSRSVERRSDHENLKEKPQHIFLRIYYTTRCGVCKALLLDNLLKRSFIDLNGIRFAEKRHVDRHRQGVWRIIVLIQTVHCEAVYILHEHHILFSPVPIGAEHHALSNVRCSVEDSLFFGLLR